MIYPAGSSYQNALDLGVGAEWTPGTWESDRFFQRLQYRMGLRRESTYLVSKGSGVNNYAVSAGISYPFNQGMNRFDLSVEFGRRGDLSANGGNRGCFQAASGAKFGRILVPAHQTSLGRLNREVLDEDCTGG